jgi:hypothetical protein
MIKRRTKKSKDFLGTVSYMHSHEIIIREDIDLSKYMIK